MMDMGIKPILQSIYIMKYLIQLSKLILVCLVFIPINLCANHWGPSQDPLTLDKSIRIRHLPNGFTYYIKPTDDTDKINLRFYVKVGSYNERYSEFQFAHLTEHLAGSEGTRNVFWKSNTTYGNQENNFRASTANNYTLYYNSFSGNDTETLRSSLEFFANMTSLKMKGSLITQEARCVRQEFFVRAKGLALNRAFNKSICKTAIFFDKNGVSPYSSWLYTYDMGGISVSSLREFYHHWYQPDRMGLVITGNIQNIDNLEQQLITLYSKIPQGSVQTEGFDICQFYLSAPPRFKTLERKEVNRFSAWNNENSKITLFFRVKKFHKNLDTKEKWLNQQLYKAMYGMIYQRLKKKGTPSWPTKKGAIVDAQLPDKAVPYFKIPAIENNPDTEHKNIQRVITILQKLYKDGFTQVEWEKQKHVILNQIISKDTSSSKYWKKQLENHFVHNEILPAQKKTRTHKWIDSLTLKDINFYLRANFTVMPDDIYITAAAGHPALSFTEKEVRGWMKEAVKQPVELKETIDITSLTPAGEKNSSLMNNKEVEGLKKVNYKEVGIDSDTGLAILELDNGVKIILNQQEPKGDVSERILVTGTSPRGASCFPEDEYYAAISATEIVKLSGAGGFTRKTIRNKLGGDFPMSAEPVQLHIKNNISTVRTRTKLEDLEKYLQLVYLYFTSPRKDSLAFVQWQDQIRHRYLDDVSNVVNPMGTDMKNAIANYLGISFFKAPTYLMSTEQYYHKQNVKLNMAMECYQTIFGNASDFTFVIKGRYEKEQVLPLLQKYLGNLPTEMQYYRPFLEKSQVKLPIGPIYHTFYANKMKTAYKLYTTPYVLTYVFTIPKDNWKDRVVLNLIKTYLRPKVDLDLRYIKGGSLYNTYTEARYSEKDALYSLAISVDALDDELEWIASECKGMITEILKNGIDNDAKNRVSQDPLFLGQYAASPKLKSIMLEYASSLTPKDIKKVAIRYLKNKHQYEFVFKEQL